MKWVGVLLISIMTLIAASSLAYASNHCTVTVNAKDYQAYIQEIPSIDAQLNACPKQVRFPISLVTSTDVVQVDVANNPGFYLNIVKDKANSIKTGSKASSYTIATNRCVMDTILSDGDYIGIAASAYVQKQLTITGHGFWNRVKLAITRPLLAIGMRAAQKKTTFNCGALPPATITTTPPAPTAPTPAAPANTPRGKPSNCDDTYMQGHQGYAQNQALWDGYMANADAVCQTRYGTGTPQGNCVHTVQLSVSGNPYYLCWYNR